MKQAICDNCKQRITEGLETGNELEETAVLRKGLLVTFKIKADKDLCSRCLCVTLRTLSTIIYDGDYAR